jgi:hypothetical protein
MILIVEHRKNLEPSSISRRSKELHVCQFELSLPIRMIATPSSYRCMNFLMI